MRDLPPNRLLMLAEGAGRILEATAGIRPRSCPRVRWLDGRFDCCITAFQAPTGVSRTTRVQEKFSEPCDAVDDTRPTLRRRSAKLPLSTLPVLVSDVPPEHLAD